MPAGGLTDEKHAERALVHEASALLLTPHSTDWATVAYFYSAYHLVKASLLRDPIFTDPTLCSNKDASLMMEDRLVTRHHGKRPRGGAREWGVNELVNLLYKPIWVSYEQLHQASVDARYYGGAKASITDVHAAHAAIKDEFVAGRLVAS
jgi:hypothetical protein